MAASGSGTDRGKPEPPEIIYKLNAESLSLSNAPAQLLGKILLNMQGLVYSFASSTKEGTSVSGRRPRKLEKLYSLNVRFEKGSVALEFFPALLSSTLEGTTEQTPVFYRIAKLLETLSYKDTNYNQLKSEIDLQIRDPQLRFAIFNYLKELIPPVDKEAKIGFVNINGKKPEFELHDAIFKRRVLQLLKKEIKNYDIEVSGVIIRIKDDVPSPSFIVRKESGELVKVDMPDEKRPQIIEFIANRVPIKLTGIGSKKKLLEIVDLGDIEPDTEIIIESACGARLKNPVKAKKSYERHDKESDFWVISNDHLGIYSVDSTVDKAKELFEDDLYNDYITYNEISDDRLTSKAQLLKRDLKRIFEG
jgi:hypothetical protein